MTSKETNQTNPQISEDNIDEDNKQKDDSQVIIDNAETHKCLCGKELHCHQVSEVKDAFASEVTDCEVCNKNISNCNVSIWTCETKCSFVCDECKQRKFCCINKCGGWMSRLAAEEFDDCLTNDALKCYYCNHDWVSGNNNMEM